MLRLIAGRNIRPLTSIAVAALIAFSPTLASAHPGGAHAGGHAHFSKSKHSNLNSNGQDSTDRDTGHARAEDRMSQNGLDHNKAGIADTDGAKPSTASSTT
ncbi:MAG TPA: hypothetical protein VKB67_13355 [Rhizomicrobium sp.]|nr:hypothetical protein [Rhizomicrobium sp.]